MKKRVLSVLWAVAYGICLLVGFLPNLTGFWKIAAVFFGLLFFVPPILVLVQGRKEKSRKTLLALRLISMASLILSLLLLVLNFFSVYFSTQAGLWLHVLLGIFACPILCINNFFFSMFLWACLLFATFPAPRPDHR